MLPAQLAAEVLEILEPAVRVEYGRQVPDWSNPQVAALVDHCAVQPEQATEITDGREATVWRLRVWCPPDAPVSASSRVRWRGASYRVVAEPQAWIDPTSQGLDHLTFAMETAKG